MVSNRGNSFGLATLFKIVLLFALLSLAVRPVGAALANREMTVLQLVSIQVMGGLYGIVVGVIYGLFQLRQSIAVLSGALNGLFVGLFMASMFAGSGHSSTAITLICISGVIVVYGLLASGIQISDRRKRLAVQPPPKAEILDGTRAVDSLNRTVDAEIV